MGNPVQPDEVPRGRGPSARVPTRPSPWRPPPPAQAQPMQEFDNDTDSLPGLIDVDRQEWLQDGFEFLEGLYAPLLAIAPRPAPARAAPLQTLSHGHAWTWRTNAHVAGPATTQQHAAAPATTQQRAPSADRLQEDLGQVQSLLLRLLRAEQQSPTGSATADRAQLRAELREAANLVQQIITNTRVLQQRA